MQWNPKRNLSETSIETEVGNNCISNEIKKNKNALLTKLVRKLSFQSQVQENHMFSYCITAFSYQVDCRWSLALMKWHTKSMTEADMCFLLVLTNHSKKEINIRTADRRSTKKEALACNFIHQLCWWLSLFYKTHAVMNIFAYCNSQVITGPIIIFLSTRCTLIYVSYFPECVCKIPPHHTLQSMN